MFRHPGKWTALSWVVWLEFWRPFIRRLWYPRKEKSGSWVFSWAMVGKRLNGYGVRIRSPCDVLFVKRFSSVGRGRKRRAKRAKS